MSGKTNHNAGNQNKQQDEQKETSLKAEILSWVEVIVIAVVLALFIDNFIIINATVPSGSMEQTIMTGSRVLGTRFSYWFKDPQRGDIVVFKYPIDEAKGKNTKYIKRIIGLPGETVEIREGAVYIDGFTFEVPEDHYLMLGDNRNNSSDARYWAELAVKDGLAKDPGDEDALSYQYVARKKILGKAYFCYWPFSDFGSLYS